MSGAGRPDGDPAGGAGGLGGIAVDWAAVDWVAVDWGTSRLRAWAVGRDGAPLASAASEDGMGRLRPEGFEPALIRLVEPWLAGDRRLPAVACGMVGARQGWREVPYRTVPCAPVAAPVAVEAVDPRIAPAIVPGLAQSDPPDVMRGEETQVAGFLAARPGFDGVLCLPGTHSKWVRISAGEVVSFATAMTGELFALLARASVLAHALPAAEAAPGLWDEAAFRDAIDEALSRPERLSAALFRIRAASLLAGLRPEAAEARLSGLLIGAELAAARPYWLGQEVALIGASALAERYAAALALQGVTAAAVDPAAATLAGLARARAAHPEAPA